MNIILEAIQYLLEQFEGPSSLNMKAYWILPAGYAVPVEYARHSQYVMNNLQDFGFEDVEAFQHTQARSRNEDPADIALRNSPSVEVHVYDNWDGRRNIDVVGLPASVRKHALKIIQLAKRFMVDTIRVEDIANLSRGLKSFTRADFAASYV